MVGHGRLPLLASGPSAPGGVSALRAWLAAARRRLGPQASTKVLSRTTRTLAGGPIALPQGPVEVTALRVVLPAGTRLPLHLHPWPRSGYLLSGRLRVVYPGQGVEVMLSAGDFALEEMGVWHWGEVVGPAPVRLLVVDQTPPGEANLVLGPDVEGAPEDAP